MLFKLILTYNNIEHYLNASDVVIVDVYVWTTESAAAKQAEDYKIYS